MIESLVIILLRYRKVRCPDCKGIRVEHHDIVAPYARYTHRLARFIFKLCEHMTLKDVAELLHMSWHQVKEIDKSELRKRYQEVDFKDVKILAIDEISIRKHHKYLTIICNFQTGEVIGVVENRDSNALSNFLKNLPSEVRGNIEAVAIDTHGQRSANTCSTRIISLSSGKSSRYFSASVCSKEKGMRCAA